MYSVLDLFIFSNNIDLLNSAPCTSVEKQSVVDSKHQQKAGVTLTSVPETKTIRLWSKDEFFNSCDVLPEDFWTVGFQNVELYEKLMR